MKLRPYQKLVVRTVAAVVVGVGAFAATSAGAQKDGARKDRHVVMISIDGLAAYNIDDPRISLPHIRALAAEGARADAMTVITPSVTWPNHTTLVTGVTPAKHGVLANGKIEAGTTTPMTVNPRRTKAELCRATTIYDVAHRAGLKTAEVDWPVTVGADTLDFSLSDHPESLKYGTPSLVKDLIGMGLLTGPEEAAFRSQGPVARDRVWTQAAVHLLKTQKPNLLLLHLLNTDGQQHAHGPSTTEAITAISLADRYVGDILQGIKDAGLKKSTSVFVVSDHGFVAVTKQIKPHVRLRVRGLIQGTNYDAYCISEGGLAYIYVPKARTQPEMVARVREALQGMEGVDQILGVAQYPALGVPLPTRDAQMPDLMLSAKDGYAFSADATGDEVFLQPRQTGSHGYVASNPKVDATFIASGTGIRKGVRVRRVRNLDVAPTIGRLLGVSLPEADGQPLTDILSK
jgi:predicted AlkP superfamily pyrophosphatase or phosphodiesterase